MEPSPSEASPDVTTLHGWQCPACGAPLDPASAEDGYVRCDYCGKRLVDPSVANPPPAPEVVLVRESELPLALPTEVDEASARARVARFLGRGLFAPGDLPQTARVGKLVWSLVPVWFGRVTARSRWEAETGKKKGDRTVWKSHHGQHQHHYADVYEVAGPRAWRGGAAQRAVASASVRFGQAKRDQSLQLDEDQVVPTRVDEGEALAALEQAVKGAERRACKKQVGSGPVRGFRVDTVIEDYDLDLIHVPLWHGHYGYRRKLYAVYVNATTGGATGSRPVSPRRVAIALLSAALVAAGLLWWHQRNQAEHQAAAQHRAALAHAARARRVHTLTQEIRELSSAPARNADTIGARAEALRKLGALGDRERALAVRAGLARARSDLAPRAAGGGASTKSADSTMGADSPRQPQSAKHALATLARTWRLSRGDAALRARVRAGWLAEARRCYAVAHQALGKKQLYLAQRAVAVALALVSGLCDAAGRQGSPAALLAAARRTRDAVAMALRARYNAVLRLVLFPDADGDPWDREGAPDPEVTLQVGSRVAQVPEHVNQRWFEQRVDLELTAGVTVRAAVRERDGGPHFERVGEAAGVLRRGRPLWLRAGWAYLQVLPRSLARRIPFRRFLAQARRRQRKDRLASWGGTLVSRRGAVRLGGSRVRVAGARRFRVYRPHRADRAFCPWRRLRAPGRGTFVEVHLAQTLLAPASGLRVTRLAGGVTAQLVSTTGHRLRPHQGLARCLHRGAEPLRASRRAGQTWTVVLPFAVPADTRPSDLYLQLTGPDPAGHARVRRIKLW